MITEKHFLEEMRNIARNYPLCPGNTLNHMTANECVARGWAIRDGGGDFIPTDGAPFTVMVRDSSLRENLHDVSSNCRGRHDI